MSVDLQLGETVYKALILKVRQIKFTEIALLVLNLKNMRLPDYACDVFFS